MCPRSTLVLGIGEDLDIRLTPQVLFGFEILAERAFLN
jgi:hypothetical protein